MSVRDKRLLDAAEISASEAAAMLERSRQAVSKGVRSQRDYFSENEVVQLYRGIAPERPGARQRFREALGGLAARLEIATADTDFEAALIEASRAWLILPDFVQALHDRPEDYRSLLTKLKDSERLEVIAFCDRRDGINAIGREFSPSWFEDERLAAVLCDVIETQTPMVILNPHLTPRCFVFARYGLAPLDTREAVRLVNALAARVVAKMSQATNIDLLVADAGAVQAHAQAVAG